MPTKRKYPVKQTGVTEFRNFVRKRAGIDRMTTMMVMRLWSEWIETHLSKGILVYQDGVGKYSTYARRVPIRTVTLTRKTPGKGRQTMSSTFSTKGGIGVVVHFKASPKLKLAIKTAIEKQETETKV